MTSSTRNRRNAQQLLEAEAEAARERCARAELLAALATRSAPGIAPFEPAELVGLFQAAPARAWGLLATLTREQRINQAIEVAAWLEGQDRPASWGAILERWERRLSQLERG